MTFRYNLPNDLNTYISESVPENAINIVELPSKTAEEIAAEQKIVIKQIILDKYDFHAVNGVAAYNDFRADLVTDLYAGLITETQAIQIGNHLEGVYNWIKKGDWKSAAYNFNDLTTNMIGFDNYKTKAYSEIVDYITNNYED